MRLEKKKGTILTIFICALIGAVGVLLLPLFNNLTIGFDRELRDLMIWGYEFIVLGVISFVAAYASFRIGAFWDFPWRHALIGADYSWWLEEKDQSDVFWRSIIILIIVSIVFFILGASFIMIPFLI